MATEGLAASSGGGRGEPKDQGERGKYRKTIHGLRKKKKEEREIGKAGAVPKNAFCSEKKCRV